MNTCTACHKPLTGGIDTFGSHDMPMCWECHSSAMFDGDPSTEIDAAIFAADAESQSKDYPVPDKFTARINAQIEERLARFRLHEYRSIVRPVTQRPRRILRTLASQYHEDGYSEHELAAFVDHYRGSLDLPYIINVYHRSSSLHVKRACLLLIGWCGNVEQWGMLREIERSSDDWLQRELAQWCRHLINPRAAAFDDLLDAMASFAQRWIDLHPVYQARLF